MNSTDPVADMFTRIRNALLVHRTEVSVPYSKFKAQIAEILVKNEYILSQEIAGEGLERTIELKINDQGHKAINEIKKISKPGRRMYAKYDEIPQVKNGRGIVIVSTSKGLLTDRQARKQKVGGELVGTVY